MNQRSMTIGRAPDNDLVVADKHVSSHHARLLREGDSILIEDLNSSNHVYVNGNAVTRKRVSVGDSVQLSLYCRLNWDHPVIRQWLAMGSGAYAPAERWNGPEATYCSSYATPFATAEDNTNHMAIWGFVCALVGLLCPVIIIDILLSVAGLVMSSIGMKKTGKRGLAIAGLVIGLVGIILGIVWLLFISASAFSFWY